MAEVLFSRMYDSLIEEWKRYNMNFQRKSNDWRDRTVELQLFLNLRRIDCTMKPELLLEQLETLTSIFQNLEVPSLKSAVEAVEAEKLFWKF